MPQPWLCPVLRLAPRATAGGGRRGACPPPTPTPARRHGFWMLPKPADEEVHPPFPTLPRSLAGLLEASTSSRFAPAGCSSGAAADPRSVLTDLVRPRHSHRHHQHQHRCHHHATTATTRPTTRPNGLTATAPTSVTPPLTARACTGSLTHHRRRRPQLHRTCTPHASSHACSHSYRIPSTRPIPRAGGAIPRAGGARATAVTAATCTEE